MSGYDQGSVYHASKTAPVGDNLRDDKERIRHRYYNFLYNFRAEGAFIYREQIRRSFNLSKYFVEVELEHLVAFDDVLAQLLVQNPAEQIAFFELAASAVARTLASVASGGPSLAFGDGGGGNVAGDGGVDAANGGGNSASSVGDKAQAMQVILHSSMNTVPLRDMKPASHISRLVSVPGIIVSASRLQAKATRITLCCRGCAHKKQVAVRAGFSGIEFPQRCEGQALRRHDAAAGVVDANDGDEGNGNDGCPLDPYIILPDECLYVDQQILKIQEEPETIPTGEMPRHMLASVDRALVGRCVPGSRVTMCGVYSIMSSRQKGDSAAIRHPYMRIFGIRQELSGAGRASFTFSPEERTQFARFAKRADEGEKTYFTNELSLNGVCVIDDSSAAAAAAAATTTTTTTTSRKRTAAAHYGIGFATILAGNSPSLRQAAYSRGGVLFADANVAAPDLLKSVLRAHQIGRVLILHAERVSENSRIGMVVRKFKEATPHGPVKAFSYSAWRLTKGFARVEKLMRWLYLQSLLLWPRTHKDIRAELDAPIVSPATHSNNNNKTAFNPFISLNVNMSDAMSIIDSQLRSLIEHCLNSIKRINSQADLRDFSVETCLLHSWDMQIHECIDRRVAQSASKTRQV